MKSPGIAGRRAPNFPLVWVCLLAALLSGCGRKETVPPGEARLSIVAAENFYGGVARQLAGHSATVTSILSNPNQDPHEFTTDAATAMAVAKADIVIYNGLGYDDWMNKLLGVQGRPGRIVIRAADLIGARAGDNPHIWYDPRTLPALAARLAEILKQPDNLAAFQKEMTAVTSKIAEIKAAHAGTVVTATEPVFGYMADALGFKMENCGFQLAVAPLRTTPKASRSIPMMWFATIVVAMPSKTKKTGRAPLRTLPKPSNSNRMMRAPTSIAALRRKPKATWMARPQITVKPLN